MIHKLHNPLELCQLKFSNDAGEFSGFASVFNGNDAVDDTILPGAFSGSLKAKKPLMLYQHNAASVIGKWLSLEETEKGLVAKGEFTPGHSVASDVYASMKHGAIDGLSIGFRIPKGGSELKEADDPWSGRVIKEVDLIEISVVSMPADNAARISAVKSDIEQFERLKDCELFLRDAGFSKSAATAFVGRVLSVSQRDAGEETDEVTRLKRELIGKNATNSILELISKI